MNTDGNTDAINRHLAEREEHDAWQEGRAALPATDEQAFANEKVKALVEALRECVLEMGVCRVFVNSRQKTKQPEGADIYDEVLDKARAALAANGGGKP